MDKLTSEEKKLIEKIINRDEKALFDIYRLYQKNVFNFIYRQINNQYIAEEVTQDVFLDFIESLRDFRGEAKLKTFLFTIARNKVVDYFRKKKLKKILFSALPKYFIEGVATVILDDELEKKELANKIKKVFDKLPNDYEVILRLKYINGERVKAIAQKLSMSFKATESLLFRARKSFIKVFKSLPE